MIIRAVFCDSMVHEVGELLVVVDLLVGELVLVGLVNEVESDGNGRVGCGCGGRVSCVSESGELDVSVVVELVVLVVVELVVLVEVELVVLVRHHPV